MTPALVCLLLSVPTADDAAAVARRAAVERYLAVCDSAQAAEIRAGQTRLGDEPARLLPLRLPPSKGDVGALVAPLAGPSIEVLEVVDEDDCVVRAWYAAEASEPRERTVEGATTFVDLWVHGIETSGLAANSPVELAQVFYVAGNQVFDTTCGGRSVPRLEVIDVREYREALATANARRPTGEDELRRWLENMVWHHRFTEEEARQATGLSFEEIRSALLRFDIRAETKPPRASDAPLLVLPYPGGRHPRVGFLDGAIRPQRETKLSVFLPWDERSYVVLDVPEAIRRNDEARHGLLYLAHTHVDTMWTKQGEELAPMEWRKTDEGAWEVERELPNGVRFGTRAIPARDAVRMEMWLANGSDETLRELRVQNCVMLKGAQEFADESAENTVFESPFVARRSSRSPHSDRWLIVAWAPCQRTWANPPCPCLHSDPQFGDCPPGESRRLRGWLSYYEGDDVRAELKRIEATGWLNVPAESESSRDRVEAK